MTHAEIERRLLSAALGPHIADVTDIALVEIVAVELDPASRAVGAAITLSYTAPVIASDESAFVGVDVDVITPDGVVHPQGTFPYEGEELGEGTVVLRLPCPAVEEDWDIRFRSRCSSYANLLVLTGDGLTPGLVVTVGAFADIADPLAVVNFHAGQMQGERTFLPNMYWDSIRQAMLIDWACMPPISTVNFSGVQVWIKIPDGASGYRYVQATGTIPLSDFTQVGDYLVHYDTIAIVLADIPVPVQTWEFIAVNVDRAGVLRVDENRVVIGPSVQLDTLPKSDYVSDFSATAVREYSEAGDQMFRLVGGWVNPAITRSMGVRVVVRGLTEADITVAEELDGSISFSTSAWQIPEAEKALTVFAVPVFGDRTSPAIDDNTPHVHLALSSQVGTVGAEHASLVTNFDAYQIGYDTDGSGQKTLAIGVTWTFPVDVRYGGLVVFMIRSGVHYPMTGVETGSSTVIRMKNFPAVNTDVTFYGLSVDINNRRNTYQDTTPKDNLTLTPPELGAAGSEYTPMVTGLSVTPSYPAMADGTSRALLDVQFTKPNDPTWGGVEIRSWDGSTWATWLKTTASPAVFDIPVGVLSKAYAVFAISYDVNGRLNTVVAATPKVDITVGNTLGQLDLTKAKATTYDSDIFVIADGKFKVWAMNGSLIVTGTITSAALDATEISVGGGGNKPGKFGVYNASGVQIGFIGVEDGVAGAWFKTLGVGGANKSVPKLAADASGNVSLTDGKIQVTVPVTGDTITIDPASSVAPIVIVNNPGGTLKVGGSSSTRGLAIDLYGEQDNGRYRKVNLQTYAPLVGTEYGNYKYNHSTMLDMSSISDISGKSQVWASTNTNEQSVHRSAVLGVGIISSLYSLSRGVRVSISDTAGEMDLVDTALKVNGAAIVDADGNAAFPNYYTKSEIDALLAGYAASSHGHTVDSAGTHDHGSVTTDGDHTHSIS